MVSSLQEISHRHKDHRWRCAQDIADLLTLLDEALDMLDKAVVSQDTCEAVCGSPGECATCINSRAREFVQRLRGEQ